MSLIVRPCTVKAAQKWIALHRYEDGDEADYCHSCRWWLTRWCWLFGCLGWRRRLA
jgi:hypothetical protein